VARAMWKGAIQFGLVTIPIKLFLATESKAGVSFNMLHAADLSRIQMKIYCPEDDEVINRSDTVKGFEYAPGEYVVIDDGDLESLPLKTVRSIEIEQFVERSEAEKNTRFVRQAYYIEPDKVARKAFALLRSVLHEKGLTAICKVVIKDREALAALDPFENTMLLSTLYWPDEIRAVGDLDLPDDAVEIKAGERAMAEQLIAAMTGEFDPSVYRDEYRDALMRIIESKVAGQELTAVAPSEDSGRIVDLMAALEASVNAAKSARVAAGTEPVSVADAQAAKSSRASAKAAATKAAATEATATEAATAADDEADAKPARKRKSA